MQGIPVPHGQSGYDGEGLPTWVWVAYEPFGKRVFRLLAFLD
ncbi:MAG: hypothetical protein QXH59_10130 [Candidatus Caldarchaeum sp.]